jgi:acetylornithine/succinyldiaminopimelate/putrescine aminotransferase
MNASPAIADTLEQILREKLPNFFRLYLNPFVVETCYALDRYVQRCWPDRGQDRPGWPSFLANSFDEALSGAIKLAKYCANLEGRPGAGLVLDPAGRLDTFASVTLSRGGRVEYITQLRVLRGEDSELEALRGAGDRFGYVVIVATSAACRPPGQTPLREFLREQSPLVIICLDRPALTGICNSPSKLLAELAPDIVVFDESFVNREVPFGAFTARRALYTHWMRPGKSTFHSTTFQPNTVASFHFLACLKDADPGFHSALAPTFERCENDAAYCWSLLAELYSSFLARAIRSLGLDGGPMRAEGHYVFAGSRKIFDGVAGVACSLRGHNPDSYINEIKAQASTDDVHAALSSRLEQLTGLPCMLPAVSGASAVENALRIGLASGFPKSYVLAFKGGFGGKTLVALAGTARATYKENLQPLYENVVYIDPFGPRVIEDLEAALKTFPVGVVQLELIQAVGGVRSLPRHVIDYLQRHRDQWGYLLFVDEVQTGMYRTGPFLHSHALGIHPDLLTLGKGTSDMMFPFSLTLYSGKVRSRLEETAPDLAPALARRCAYDWGDKTVLNVLQQAEMLRLPQRVAEAGSLFSAILSDHLASCKAVRDIRVHGLLIGIELDTRAWPRRWLKKNAGWLYLLSMFKHRAFPVFVGFCQYEPNVLKLTPPLTINPDEVRQVCVTLSSVLRSPLYKLVPPAVSALFRAKVQRNMPRNRAAGVTHESFAR